MAAAQALATLAGTLWHDAKVSSPGAFAERFGDPEVARAIADLNRARYARDGKMAWEGGALWLAYRGARRISAHRATAGRTEVLPALDPHEGGVRG